MRLKAHLLACAALTALATPAFAQSETDEVATRDVITVTTQKREQSLADVPINLTAYDTQRLSLLGIEQFDDLSDFVPGLEVQEQSPNNPGFVIRGITSDDGAATGEARVAVFQDGVSISRARSAYVELFDIERVEVAKGPQATLFGRGALIGGINVIQNKAQIEGGYTGSAELTVGDFNRFEARGHINVPISDTMALRFAGVHKQRDGYVENALGGDAMNGVELSALRISGRWTPNDQLNVDIIGNYQTDTPEGGTSFKSGAILPVPGGSLDPWEPAALNTFGGFEGGAPLGIDRQVYGVTILTDYTINDTWSLSSISGWRGFESVEIFDPDGFAAELLVVAEDASGRQWSQEVRFNYDAGGPVTGFFGGSYFYESGSQRIPLATNEIVAQAFILGLDPATAPDFSLGFFQATGQILPLNTFYLEETANRGETTAIDLFGDVTYAVTDRLDLTAGLRWTREEKEASLYGGNLNGVNTISFTPTLFLPATPNNGSPVSSDTREFDDFTWRFVAAYDVSDNLNAWASYARGRRPDVISFDSTAPDLFVEVPAELVDSYEVGAFWSNDTTTFQSSVFYSEYQNFQTGRFEPNNAVFITDNAGQATQYGVELELTHQFNEFAQLFTTYAYNYSEFDQTDENGNPQEFAGNTFRLSPDHAVSVGLLSEFDLPVGRLSIIPTLTWQSEVFFDNDNDLTDAVQDETQTDYGIADVRVRYDAPNERFYAVAFVENLLDEEYIIDAGNTGDAFGIPTFIAGSPRMVGVRFGAEF